MKKLAALALLFSVPAFAAYQAKDLHVQRHPSAAYRVHPCEAEALAAADKLIRLHYTGDSSGKLENLGLSDQVARLAPIKSPNGKLKYDVLEVRAHIYKGEFRMHFIYDQNPESCNLMGQEILDLSSL